VFHDILEPIALNGPTCKIAPSEHLLVLYSSICFGSLKCAIMFIMASSVQITVYHVSDSVLQ